MKKKLKNRRGKRWARVPEGGYRLLGSFGSKIFKLWGERRIELGGEPGSKEGVSQGKRATSY